MDITKEENTALDFSLVKNDILQNIIQLSKPHPNRRVYFDTRVNSIYIGEIKKDILGVSTRIKFIKQVEKFKTHLNTSKFNIINTLYENVIDYVLNIGSKQIELSITSFPSISFKLIWKEGIKVVFEVFANEASKYKVVYSIYSKNELIEMNSGSLSEASEYIKNTLIHSSSFPTKDFADISKDTRLFEFA